MKTKKREEHNILAVLKDCIKQKDLNRGTEVHADILKSGLLFKDCYVASTLVDMYAKCGAVEIAAEALEELPHRNVVTWSALIAGYAQLGYGEEALKCFERMQHEGLSPNAVTYTCTLKACGSIGAAEKGRQIHEELSKQGLLNKDVVLGTTLVDMYAKCGALANAARVFRDLPDRNVVSWNALIAGYAQQGQGYEAIKCFEKMQSEHISPDRVTFICILKACSSIKAVEEGEKIYHEIVRRRLLGRDVVLDTAVVDMYAKCSYFERATQVLNELPVRSVVSWNALIAGYVQQEQNEEVLRCFQMMQSDGITPDCVTFICMLKACASIGALEEGEKIHEEIAKHGFLRKEKDYLLGTTLVDMYARCGALSKAAQVHNGVIGRDVATWNALIAGYAQHREGEEALKCFENMQGEGFCPNGITFICVLKACASIGATDKGEEIHLEISKQGLLEKDVALGNTLVDMYSKCGALAKAVQVLEAIPVRDVVSWSALIAGYTQQGQGNNALKCFEQMQCEGLSPNAVTLASVLSACGHSGLLQEGQRQFLNMRGKYGIVPEPSHLHGQPL